MKKLKFPSAQTLLILIAALVALLTWIVPAGKYDSLMYLAESNKLEINRPGESVILPATQATLDSLGIRIPLEKFTNGDIYKPVGIPGTYRELPSRPQGLAALAQSPIRGIIKAADIIFLVLVIGGLIGVMNVTGAFDAGIQWITRVLRERESLLIVIVTSLIAAGGTTFGMAEETMAFYPILIPVFRAARYDSMVGLACIFLGSAIGSMCSTTNPFSTIIGSDSAGINWLTGIEFRVIMLVVCLVITIVYILQYARKVRSNPATSVTTNPAPEELIENPVKKDRALTPRLWLIIGVFSMSFVVMVIGVSFLHWWFVEMTAVFLVAAIVIGFIGRIPEGEFVREFSKGAADLLSVAFIIGIARGVTILMEDGLISDTVLYHASSLTEGMNKGLFVNVALLFFGGLSFFMPSSSGMAVLTMPIMSPLADSAGIGRETVVDAYIYGLGLFYLVNPTGLILAALALVNITFYRWLRFVLPLLLILTLVTMAGLTISVYI